MHQTNEVESGEKKGEGAVDIVLASSEYEVARLFHRKGRPLNKIR